MEYLKAQLLKEEHKLKEQTRKKRTRDLIQFGAYFEKALPHWEKLDEKNRRELATKVVEALQKGA